MARTKRVRSLPTGELSAEFSELWLRYTFLNHDEPDITDAELLRLEAKLDRVGRELARRSYRFRAHGKACSCEDCMQLLDEWTTSGRRVPREFRPWQ